MRELQPTTPTGYAELLRELKQKIRSAQLRASLAVNQELVLLDKRENWSAKAMVQQPACANSLARPLRVAR
jgi:hypothetical protein